MGRTVTWHGPEERLVVGSEDQVRALVEGGLGVGMPPSSLGLIGDGGLSVAKKVTATVSSVGTWMGGNFTAS